MRELFKNSYYWLDLLVGFGSPILLFTLYRLKKVDRLDWRLFWLGAFIGLFWEIPIFVLSGESSLPIVTWPRPFPFHYSVFMISHTLWDGAIFVVGIWVVKLLCPSPIFAKFNWKELAILIAWGQITAFLVEFSSVMNDGWIYVKGYWWNPVMIYVNAHPIPIMMQVLWFIAPVAFYFVALKWKAGD